MGLLYPEQVVVMDLEQMQTTHEQEIELLNSIDKLAIRYERDGDPSLREELEVKLDEYVNHVKEHFASEERLMEKYDFHAYEMHKMAHDMFLMDLAYAQMMWKEHGDLQKMITFIRKTPEWLIMHIDSVDKPTAAFLAKRINQKKE